MTKKEMSNLQKRVGVYIINTGELTSITEDRFKFAQILKASFLIDFNAARIMTKDLFIKLRNEPNTPYPIKGFNFDSEVFDELASKYKISYGYIFANAATLTDIKPKEISPIQLVKSNLNTIEAYVTKLEAQLTEKEGRIASLEQSLLNLSRSITKSQIAISEPGVMAQEILKDFNLEKELIK